MSIPILCGCGKLVGEVDGMAWLGGAGEGFHQCPVDGHKEPVRTERSRLFGLTKEVTIRYPETYTHSSWQEYVGPANRFLLWFAIVFGTEHYPVGGPRGFTINGKQVSWEPFSGFSGDGLAELMKKA